MNRPQSVLAPALVVVGAEVVDEDGSLEDPPPERAARTFLNSDSKKDKEISRPPDKNDKIIM